MVLGAGFCTSLVPEWLDDRWRRRGSIVSRRGCLKGRMWRMEDCRIEDRTEAGKSISIRSGAAMAGLGFNVKRS